MLRFSVIALLVAVTAPLEAQVRCTARVHDLQVRETGSNTRNDSGAVAATVLADGATCDRPNGDDSLTRFKGRLQFATIQPAVLQLHYVSGVPDQRNPGGIWNGVGLNALLRVGAGFDDAWFHGVLAPEISYAQNRIFPFYPGAESGRNGFSSHWYVAPNSIDLPTRYGARPVMQFDLGQSAAWATVAFADMGVSTTTQAWGPGVRGHLLLGPDAPGIPRAFIRTNQPVRTPIGLWSGTAFLGTLTESAFFDAIPLNDLRTLMAWNLAWSPNEASHVVLGFAHATMQTGALFGLAGRQIGGPGDQMNSFYAQVAAPRDGLRAWMEVARSGPLPGIRQFFEIPYQGISYLVGLEQAIPMTHGTLHLTGEAVDLEQPTDIRGGVRQDFYTSSNIPQGWTQRGQILGDGIGPGGQSQWLAADWVAASYSAGVFVERVRWNEDAFLRQYLPNLDRNDVSLRWGLRAGKTVAAQHLDITLSAGKRLNYLFQNGDRTPGLSTIDITLFQLQLRITPLSRKHS